MAGKKGMHDRLSTSPTYEAAIRAKIRAGMIVNHLQNHILGRVEMSTSQVQAGLGLLKKVAADRSESKSDITVRRAETLTEQQARMMAEEYVDRAQRGIATSTPEPVGVHDSLPPGLPASSGTPQDS